MLKMSQNINNSLNANRNVQLNGNGIRFSFGTYFGLIKVSKNGSKRLIKPLKGRINNVFLAHFDEEDVDFQIFVDNRFSSRGIVFSINLDDYRSRLYVRPHMCLPFDSFTSCGNKFHIKSLSSDEAKQLVSINAHKHGVSYQKAFIHCSRITFNVEVEKEVLFERPLNLNLNGVMISGDEIQVFVMTLGLKGFAINIGVNNTIEELKTIVWQMNGIRPEFQKLRLNAQVLENSQTIADCSIRNKSTLILIASELFESFIRKKRLEKDCTQTLVENRVHFECHGIKIQVFVRTLRAKTILINIGINNTVQDFKKIVSQREGIPFNRFRLISQGKQLEDLKTISDSNVRNESLVHVVQWLRGGGTAIRSEKSTQLKNGLNLSDLESDEEEPEVESDDEKDEENEEMISCERQVICFGEKSKQKLGIHRDFKRDYSFPIYSFTIEFLMTSK